MAPILTGPLVAAATIIKGVEVVSGSIADARIALHWDHTQITLFHKVGSRVVVVQTSNSGISADDRTDI